MDSEVNAIKELLPEFNNGIEIGAGTGIFASLVSSVFGAIFEEKKKEKDNIIKFGDAYQLTEDELNMVIGRRHSCSSYPEEAKNKDEYAFYEANGFEEVSDSRLLYKYVGRG